MELKIKKMNRLTVAKRAQVLASLVEGTSINSTCRITGVSKHAILNLLEDMGCACAAVALHFMHYNFCRVHKTLRVTPAMEARLTDHVWSMEELVSLLETKLEAVA